MKIDMRSHIKEQSDLALFYAEDGAYHEAARVLLELAVSVKDHAAALAAILANLEKPVSR